MNNNRGQTGEIQNKNSQNRDTLPSVQFFNALVKYIPSLVLQNWMEKQIQKELAQKLLKSKQKGKILNDDQNPDDTLEEYSNEKMNNIADLNELQMQIAQSEQLPYIQELETVVLFADISGFTKISEACASLGIRGNEELAFCINRYMEGMVKNLAKFGGDIIKFVGDAMIVMWPRKSKVIKMSDTNAESKMDDDEKVLLIRKAIQCAIDIQKEMNNKKIMANVSGLSVKIGIAYGQCALLYVGGVLNRSEFFTVGPALTNALSSEEHASAGGQIIVSETAFKYVKNVYYEGEYAEDTTKYYLVKSVKEGVRGRADAILMKAQLKVDRIAGIQAALRQCVPKAIIPYLEIGYEQYGSETRTLTVMFVSLGVDLSSSSTNEGRNKIQKIVTAVQQQVYRLEGSLNKLVMDDKGSTLICIWGLSPMAHNDDPQRAILTALNMRQALHKIQGTWCNVGIATGDVFSGVVGTQGSRKEFSVLGDTVNLAARIMYWPLKYGKKGFINCCLRTKNEAMNTFSFNYGGHQEFKGKSISIPIFEPIDPREEFQSSYLKYQEKGNKIIPPQCLLRLKYNPLIIKREVNLKKYDEKLIGKQQFILQIYDEIKLFFFNNNINETKQSPLIVIISGEIGSGKTHCARALCEKLQKDQEMIQTQQIINLNTKQIAISKNQNISQAQQNQQSIVLPIFSSSPNLETRMKFLGSWRSIFQSMFEYKRRLIGMSVAETLNQILQGHYDKLDLILHIFGFSPYDTYETSQEYKKQMENFEKLKKEVLNGREEEKQVQRLDLLNPLWFLQREKYSNTVTDQVLELCLFFISDFIGEDSYDDLSNSNDSYKNSANYMNQKSINFSQYSQNDKFNQKQILKSPIKNIKNSSRSLIQQLRKMCILIFDNFSYMEEESWSLMLRVFDSCKNICIVCLVNIDHKQQLLMPKFQPIKKNQGAKNQNENENPYYEDEIDFEKAFQKEGIIFDVPSVSSKDLKIILSGLAPDFQQSFSEEIQKMTDIVDPEHTIKTDEQCQEWTRILSQQYNLNRVFTSIDDEIINLIVTKCDGVTLMCIEYFLILLKENFIRINHNNKVVCTSKLEECLKLQNFQSIMVPPSVHKRRLRNMDDFIKGINNQVNTQKNQDIPIRGVMLMKAAAIIGDEFGTQALIKIMSQRNETNSSITQILKELELHEFIEILDESDPKNLICRFNKSFLRESIYQVMLFREQKQVLHRRYVEHLQSLPITVMDKNIVQIELQKLRNHILIGEDLKDESELPFKQMQGLIVKQMQSLLVNNDKKQILYKAIVYKQGKAANKKISKRLLILYPQEIQWYHNASEYEQGMTPLGSIKIIDIYKTSETLMQEGRTYDFDIHFSQCVKKGQLEKQASFINFGCLSENDRSHWISRIEFLRAKIVYEEYVNKFVNIQFPLKKIDQSANDTSQQSNDQIFDQLAQFGKNLKQNSKINNKLIQKYFYSSNKKQGFKNIHGLGAQNNGQRASILSNPTMIKSLNSNIGEEILSISGDFTINQLQQNLNSAQDLAKKLTQLYRASMVCFFGQTQANANKQQFQHMKNKPLGFLPNYFKLDQLEISDSPLKDQTGKIGNKTFDMQNNISQNISQQKMYMKQSQENINQRSTQNVNLYKRKNSQDFMNLIQETSEKDSSPKSRQNNSALNLRSPQIYSRKQKDRNEKNQIQTDFKIQYQQKELVQTAESAKKQTRLSLKNVNSQFNKEQQNNFVKKSQENSVDSAKQVSVQLKMLEQSKKSENNYLNRQRFSIETKDEQVHNFQQQILQQNHVIIDKQRNFTFSDKKLPYQDNIKSNETKSTKKHQINEKIVLNNKNIIDLSNIYPQQAINESNYGIQNKNQRFNKKDIQQDSFINEIRAIEEFQKTNKTKQNQDLSQVMHTEQSQTQKKIDQTQIDNSIILPSLINEDMLEQEISKRVNKSLNKFFINLNYHLDSSKKPQNESFQSNNQNSFFNNLITSAISTTVTKDKSNNKNQGYFADQRVKQIQYDQQQYLQKQKNGREEGMLKNNVMSQTNSVQSKQKLKLGYKSNDSREMIEGLQNSDDSFVEDPDKNSPLRNKDVYLQNNQNTNQFSKNVTPLKNRRMQKSNNRQRNENY